MQYKKGNNNFDFCSAFKGKDLLSSTTFTCVNDSNTRKYVIDLDKKTTIMNGFNSNGIKLSNINWIGECRTGLKNGTKLQYGYSKFIKED